MSSKSTVDNVLLFSFRRCWDGRGTLIPITANEDFPFSIARVFIVYNVPEGDDRGNHAHRKCSQVLQCLSGTIKVACTDKDKTISYTLDEPAKALLIPPGIWAQQIYYEKNTILQCYCDRKYEEEDYIRDMSIYKAWKND